MADVRAGALRVGLLLAQPAMVAVVVAVLGGMGSAASAEAAGAAAPAQAFDHGATAFRKGDLSEAARSWAEAARLSIERNDPAQGARALLGVARASVALGYPNHAIEVLEQALVLLTGTADQARIAAAESGLGNAYLATGSLETADQHLSAALALAQQLGDAGLTAAVLNDQGNLYAARHRYEDALRVYVQSASLASPAGDQLLTARAWCNAALAKLNEAEFEKAAALLDQAAEPIRHTEASDEKAAELIRLARAYDRLRSQMQGAGRRLLEREYQLLNEAALLSRSLDDERAGSWAWGYLGGLYEGEGRYDDALTLTRRASFAAQAADLPEALYRWQWQAGRLLRTQGKLDDAIASYRIAVSTLQSIRPEMRSGYAGAQSPFDEAVRPVYLDMVDLLLQRAAARPDSEQMTRDLVEARDTMEAFKVAELQDYFRDECVDATRTHVVSLETVSPHVAVIYPIMLQDRLELLISLPSGLKRAAVAVSEEQLTHEVNVFRTELEFRIKFYLARAQMLYDWLIRPLEPLLQSANIDTLVFVPSGALLTIPMAALHDGKRFLIQKYAIAITPALTLTDPRPFPRANAKVLLLGLSESVQGSKPLPSVEMEIGKIRDLYGGTVLLNQDFRIPRIEQAVEDTQFNVVHIASHGVFGAHADNTFILTFDGRLTMNGLDQWVGLFKAQQTPLELLALSACTTAAGDDRAALGLAGVAVKAGAKSALASLWKIDDRAAALLVPEFYRFLRDPTVSKAVALQRAQVELLEQSEFSHPTYWSPFLLINNWL